MRKVTAAAVIVMVTLASAAFADDTYLTSSPGSWTDDGVWSAGAPQAGDMVHVGTGGGINPGTANISDAGSYSIEGIWIGQGSSKGTLNVTDGSTLAMNGLYMAPWDWSGPDAKGTLNVIGSGSTVSVAGDAYIGGEGNGEVNAIGGGVVNFGASVWIGHNGNVAGTLSVDASSQINLTSNGTQLRFRGAGSQTLDFANTPTNGIIGVKTDTVLWVGQGGGSTTTYLTMGSASNGVQFGSLYMAAFDWTSGDTVGDLTMNGAAVTFGDAGIGGEGVGKLHMIQTPGMVDGLTINGSLGIQSGNASIVDLVFDNDTFAYTVFESGGYTMIGKSDDWALRWLGSHAGELETMLGDGRITVTFANTIPEPATMSLLVLGGVAALIRRKK
ncbi:MAG: PEP-CTERM sorting domain-containing protein [Planctomycetaceae bacterium]|nr:PEP-CTERM sorting domain-containing protein [Planctomycetaceae bacterium]